MYIAAQRTHFGSSLIALLFTLALVALSRIVCALHFPRKLLLLLLQLCLVTLHDYLLFAVFSQFFQYLLLEIHLALALVYCIQV